MTNHPKMESNKEIWRPQYTDKGIVSGKWVRAASMVRNDGVSIVMTGIGLESQRHLLYKNHDIAIEFWASRYDADGRVLENSWLIDIGTVVKELRPEYQARQIHFNIVTDLANSISQVLPMWPVDVKEQESPANQVKIITRVGMIEDVIAQQENYSAYVSQGLYKNHLYLLQKN